MHIFLGNLLTVTLLVGALGGCSGDVQRINPCYRYAETLCRLACPEATAGDCFETRLDSCNNYDLEAAFSYEMSDDEFAKKIDACRSALFAQPTSQCIYSLPDVCSMSQ